MKQEWVTYLQSIGMANPLIERVDTIHQFYQSIYGDIFTEIFVSDYITSEGIREYESLWFMSRMIVCEAKSFINKDDFDGAKIKYYYRRWHILKHDYDFITSNATSRLMLDVSNPLGFNCVFKATQNNCDQLKKIFTNFILPNLV